jgi:hypothetical protein
VITSFDPVLAFRPLCTEQLYANADELPISEASHAWSKIGLAYLQTAYVRSEMARMLDYARISLGRIPNVTSIQSYISCRCVYGKLQARIDIPTSTIRHFKYM